MSRYDVVVGGAPSKKKEANVGVKIVVGTAIVGYVEMWYTGRLGRCVGCAGVGACDMSVETGLAEGPVHYGRIVEKHWVDER